MAVIAIEPAAAADDVVSSSDSFWPAISLTKLRQVMRLPGTVTQERLLEATQEATANTHSELSAWREKQLLLGFSQLAEIPSEQINGVSVLVQRYQRAIFCLTKANLCERYLGIDSTGQGKAHAAVINPQIDELWRDARWALRDVQGLTRGIAALV